MHPSRVIRLRWILFAYPLSLVPALLSLSPVARSGEVTVIRSDGRSLEIEYRALYAPARAVSAGGTQYTLLDFAGGVPPGGSSSSGGPDLRSRTIPVAFPSTSGNTLRVIAADYEDIPNTLVAPVPTLHRGGKSGSYLSWDADPARYGRSGFVPAQVAGLTPVGRVRSMFLGGVQITPVQFNAASRTVRKYTRVVVEVTFGPRSAELVNRGEEPLLKNVPVNYAAARTWNAGSLARVAAPVPSVLASGAWYRLTVTAEGIYRLDASYLSSLGVPVGTIDPRTIRIFGNGGRELSEDITSPRPSDLVEDAIYVAGESDGKFDAGDYVLFYGKGARGWSYDAQARTLRHYIHDYAEVNYYWLTYGGSQGKRMAAQASLASSAGDLLKDTFTDGIANEEEKRNLLLSSLSSLEGSGRRWFGEEVNAGGTASYTNPLPGADPNGTVVYRYALAAASPSPSGFTISEGNAVIGYAMLDGIYSYKVASEGTFQVALKSPPASGVSRISFAYNGSGTDARGWIDWFEILYTRALAGLNDSLRFYAPDTTAVVEYHLQNFSAMPMVFNVSDHANVRLVTGLGGSFLFRAQESAGSPSAYWAVAGNSWRVPSGGTKAANQNIHGYASGADFIIVTAPRYRSGADRLAAYRSDPSHGGMNVYVADVNQIYNEFSGGVTDVTAIRDFLYFAYRNWTPAPVFVLMLGQASFDYKGILGAQTSVVPTWETTESLLELDSWGTDDYYAKFGGTEIPSLVMGRVSARTAAESDGFVEKLIRYENNSAVDEWKMRMLFVGDDAWTPEDGESAMWMNLSLDAETLSGPLCTPDEFEKKKIYLAEYPTVFTAAGRRKPGAAQALIDQINQGVLAVHFTGHGNNVQLSNSDVFDVATSVHQLVNADRLTVFFLAACNLSQWDNPVARCGSEEVINKPDGGAIGVVASNRKVIEFDNAVLMQRTFQAMFRRDAYGRVVAERPATALYLHKASGGNSANDQMFSYLGDPTMYLQFPVRYASFDSVNAHPLDSAGGPLPAAAELRSLSRVTVTGTLRDASNNVDASYNGRVRVTLNDGARLQTIPDFIPGTSWQYRAPGALLYRGENSVTGGRFTATFIVPKDIQYGDSLSRGRLVAYAYRTSGAGGDAAGYTGKVHIGGTDTSVVNPKTGPAVQVYLGSRGYRAGDLVGENPLLIVDLADSSGINTSTSGVGHRIEAWLNNASQSTDLTNYYTSKLDSYREGSIQYQLQNVPEGKNTIRVRAWDSFDNSGSAETDFQVASTDGLTVTDVFNYPNPFGASGTEFTFRQNQSAPLNVTVKIFTVAGRLVRTLESYGGGDSFVKIPWDGRDRDGDVIANGVYLYKLIVRTVDGRFSSETLGKLSKVR